VKAIVESKPVKKPEVVTAQKPKTEELPAPISSIMKTQPSSAPQKGAAASTKEAGHGFQTYNVSKFNDYH
jgi:hypothetical protein